MTWSTISTIIGENLPPLPRFMAAVFIALGRRTCKESLLMESTILVFKELHLVIFDFSIEADIPLMSS